METLVGIIGLLMLILGVAIRFMHKDWPRVDNVDPEQKIKAMPEKEPSKVLDYRYTNPIARFVIQEGNGYLPAGTYYIMSSSVSYPILDNISHITWQASGMIVPDHYVTEATWKGIL